MRAFFVAAFIAHTTAQNNPHNPSASRISFGFGEKTSMKPRPFTSAEKLDTKNGIMNSRAICHGFNLFPCAVELIRSAVPTIAASPKDVSQILRLGSK